MKLYRMFCAVLLCAVLFGCSQAPTMEVQQEYNEKFKDVPVLPGGREVDRRFFTNEGKVFLEVTVDHAGYRVTDRDYVRSWGADMWRYGGTNYEVGGHWYVTEGWLLTVKPGRETEQVILLLRRNP